MTASLQGDRLAWCLLGYFVQHADRTRAAQAEHDAEPIALRCVDIEREPVREKRPGLRAARSDHTRSGGASMSCDRATTTGECGMLTPTRKIRRLILTIAILARCGHGEEPLLGTLNVPLKKAVLVCGAGFGQARFVRARGLVVTAR